MSVAGDVAGFSERGHSWGWRLPRNQRGIVIKPRCHPERSEGPLPDRRCALGGRGPSTPQNNSLRESFCFAQDDNFLLMSG